MLFTLPVFYSWLLGPSEVLWLKLPGCCTRILFFNYILLGHKRSLGGILSCCWVRWSCGWWSLPVTWFSWSSKDLTRIVILLPCWFFSLFWQPMVAKFILKLCMWRARGFFRFASWSEGFLVVSSFLEFFSPWLDSLSTQLAKFIWKLYLLCLTGDLIKPWPGKHVRVLAFRASGVDR